MDFRNIKIVKYNYLKDNFHLYVMKHLKEIGYTDREGKQLTVYHK